MMSLHRFIGTQYFISKVEKYRQTLLVQSEATFQLYKSAAVVSRMKKVLRLQTNRTGRGIEKQFHALKVIDVVETLPRLKHQYLVGGCFAVSAVYPTATNK